VSNFIRELARIKKFSDKYDEVKIFLVGDKVLLIGDNEKGNFMKVMKELEHKGCLDVICER